MRVLAQRDIATELVLVYVESTPGWWLSSGEGQNWTVVQVEPGQQRPVAMRIPMDIAQPLGLALLDAPEFTERHLQDALKIRDRLLTLVEKGWER